MNIKSVRTFIMLYCLLLAPCIFSENIELIEAVNNNNIESVRKQLEIGANPNEFTYEIYKDHPIFRVDIKIYSTILMKAIEKGYNEISKLLIEKGANVNLSGTYGRTPLMSAASKDNIEIVEMLLKKGALVNIKNTSNGLGALEMTNNIDIMKLLIKYGANVNNQDIYGATLLMYASGNGKIEIVKVLLENGVNPNIRFNLQGTSLMQASDKGYFDIVKLLVENGANINDGKITGGTALGFAIVKNHYDIAKYLLEKGADIKVKIYGESILFSICDVKMLELLLSYGANINELDINKRNLLIYSAEKGNLDMVKYCVEKGIDINQGDDYNNTPLIYACDRGYIDIIKYLIEKDVNLNHMNKNNQTALKRVRLDLNNNISIGLPEKDILNEIEQILINVGAKITD